METRVTLRPGDKGTGKLAARFGKRLVCVRYRYDAAGGRRYTTVDLIVAESEWQPRSRGCLFLRVYAFRGSSLLPNHQLERRWNRSGGSLHEQSKFGQGLRWVNSEAL